MEVVYLLKKLFTASTWQLLPMLRLMLHSPELRRLENHFSLRLLSFTGLRIEEKVSLTVSMIGASLHERAPHWRVEW